MELPFVSASLGIVHPICIERAANAEVWDTQGKRYIDFVGGIGVLNLGHGNTAIVNKISEQLNLLTHSAFNAVPHKGYLDLVKSLNDFVPINAEKAFMLVNSGSEATENALKISRAWTGKEGVIAFDDGFHGRTLAALNLNGKVKPYKNNVGLLPGTVFHVPYPSSDSQVSSSQAISALERLFAVEIDLDNIAAIIFEPVQGEGGFRFMDREFALWLRKFCTQHNIVLIADEIQSGFGRTGRKFAFEALEIEPDLLLMGKSMANGLPLAAVGGRREVMDALPPQGLGGTYSGNALACAASLEVIRIMTPQQLSEWGGAMENMILNAYQRWHNQDFPMIGALNGTGAMRGIVFNDTANFTGAMHLESVIRSAREAGLLLMPSGRKRNILRLLPPLTIPKNILLEGLAIIESSLLSLSS